MVLQFHPNLRKGQRWQSCDVILRLHPGDWHVPADAHRAWLEKIVEKPKTPERFPRRIADLHVPILVALRSRDPDQAEAAYHLHFEAAGDMFRETWSDDPEPAQGAGPNLD